MNPGVGGSNPLVDTIFYNKINDLRAFIPVLLQFSKRFAPFCKRQNWHTHPLSQDNQSSIIKSFCFDNNSMIEHDVKSIVVIFLLSILTKASIISYISNSPAYMQIIIIARDRYLF